MKKIIATVGPALLNKVPLNQVHNERNIYRINGAHGDANEIENYILKIKSQVASAEILMDLPGNKVRTANITQPIDIQKGSEFCLGFEQTNFQQFYQYLNPGDIIWANDSTFKFVVKDIDNKGKKITFVSHSDGQLLNNKGMHVRGIHANIPFLFDKDKILIELANKHKLAYVGLSFVRHAQDIQQAKKLIDDGITLISKVETRAAVTNLVEILDEVEHILIDRGDLSTEVGLEKIPEFQDYIISKALFHNKKVFLATQFLKNMELNPVPSIPEVIDLHKTLKSGIFGIQMSEETAVGKYPKECLDFIVSVMDEIHNLSI